MLEINDINIENKIDSDCYDNEKRKSENTSEKKNELKIDSVNNK